MKHHKHRILRSPWLIWGLGAAFFLAEYFIRVSPGVMTQDLMRAFSINAAELGSVVVFFYVAYIGMQLPVGMLVDRYGPHRLLTVMALICGIGGVIFASATTPYIAAVARFLMGFSAAFAFIGSLKLASVWFPPQRFGLMAGLTQGLGMIGAAIGEAPTALLMTYLGWRNTIYIFAMIFFVLAILIGFLVRDYPTDYPLKKIKQSRESNILSNLLTVLKNKHSWINAVFIGCFFASTACFGELWGVSYISRVYDVSTTNAASAVGLIFIGLAIGAPMFGWISDRIQRRKPAIYVSATMTIVIFVTVLYATKMPFILVYLLMFLYGIFNGGFALGYAIASEINPHRIAGTSMAFANMASVIIGAAFQPLVGKLLVWHWSGVYLHGTPFYSAADYEAAVILLPIALVIALLASFFLKETHCKPLDYAQRKGVAGKNLKHIPVS
ncbi:MAG: MFS transporter [Pseudomonadota bacterium]